MGVNDFLKNISNAGCSPYFVTSALGAAYFGELGRKHQKELVKENLAFREKMQGIRESFAEERNKEQKQMMRESYELGRLYLQKQTELANEARKNEIEYSYFCQKIWPLDVSVYSINKLYKELFTVEQFAKLSVLIAKTEIHKQGNGSSTEFYITFCKKIKEDVETCIPDVKVWEKPWKSQSVSPVADTMNINYILQGKPILLIYPYVEGRMFHLDFAYWSFCKTYQSVLYQKALEFPYDEDNMAKVYDSIKYIIGFVRDFYMIYEYHKPAILPQLLDEGFTRFPEIRYYIEKQYRELVSEIGNNEKYQSLCSDNEMCMIHNSLKSNFLELQ